MNRPNNKATETEQFVRVRLTPTQEGMAAELCFKNGQNVFRAEVVRRLQERKSKTINPMTDEIAADLLLEELISEVEKIPFQEPPGNNIPAFIKETPENG